MIFPLPLPPSKAAAPLKVTKSLTEAPCPFSVTVIVASLFPTLANVASPAEVVSLIGVISLKLDPSFI